MRINALTKDNCTLYGQGPERSALLLHKRTGLGTVPHAMPALWQLKQDGFDVTVNCRAFQAPIYRTLGIKVTTEREPLGPYRATELAKQYERIISVPAWDGWECWDNGEHAKGTMEEYSDIVGTKLPEHFSWLNFWKPEIFAAIRPYVLFNPNATEVWRSLPKDVADAMEKELRNHFDVLRIEGNEYENWETFRDFVYNATVVVTAESGMSNIAGAMNRPMVVMTGVTEAESHVGQYRRYIPDLDFAEVKGFQPKGCAMPCYRQPSKGFFNNKCLGKNAVPLCLKMIDTDSVVHHALTLYEHGTILSRCN